VNTIYNIRAIVLILALFIPILSVRSQVEYPVMAPPGSELPNTELPSEITYNNIQKQSGVNLRVDGVDDESELGGVDAPDPSELPVGDAIYPLLSLSLIYGIYMAVKQKGKVKQSRRH